jgi:hypothetical protein
MATQLPVRIEFRLPDGWQAAPPDEVGAPGVAFVALHPASRAAEGGFTANITIAGQVRDPALTMLALADESVRRLEQNAGTVHVRSRTELGSPEAPGLTQALDILATVRGEALPLVQTQVLVSMTDVDDPAKRVVLELVLTCTAEQLDTVIGDFQEFVRTVRPAEAEAGRS